MRRLGVRALLPVCAAFLAASMVACSQGDVSPTEPGDNTGEKTEPQKPGDKPESKESGDKPEYCGDREVIYHHDTVTVYRDTAERVIEKEGASYTSFLYSDSTGAIDTLTKASVGLECDIGESEFSCQEKLVLVLAPIDGPAYEPVVYRELVIDTVHCHVTITDTVVKDTFYRDSYSYRRDTTFINYGENRLTDYIVPEFVYDSGKHPFDSTEIRDFFDTLDVSDSQLGGKKRLTVNSDLSFHDFPLTVLGVMPVIDTRIEYKIIEKSWPEKRSPEENTYEFENFNELASDTTVTWTLEYTRYEGGQEEKDSIQVTTFFKTARASLGD